MSESQLFSRSTDTPENASLPRHVAVIMDGNGRWAKRLGLSRIAGHRRGVESVRRLVKYCAKLNIDYLTLFAFSSENWRRPVTEVRLLMELLSNALESEVKKLNENNVRLRILGDLNRFSPKIQLLIRNAEDLTGSNSGLNLTIAANYGGRWDITDACRKIAIKTKSGEIDPTQIDSQTIESHLSTSSLPEPDLFIRTGGEQRISNFLLWQLAYTELYFTEVLWPEFDNTQFDTALESFYGRQRRFGRTGDQVVSTPKVNNA